MGDKVDSIIQWHDGSYISTYIKVEPYPCAQLPVVPDECVEQWRGFAGHFSQPELASAPEPVSPEDPGTPAAPVHFGHETPHLFTSYATSLSGYCTTMHVVQFQLSGNT